MKFEQILRIVLVSICIASPLAAVSAAEPELLEDTALDEILMNDSPAIEFPIKFNDELWFLGYTPTGVGLFHGNGTTGETSLFFEVNINDSTIFGRTKSNGIGRNLVAFGDRILCLTENALISSDGTYEDTISIPLDTYRASLVPLGDRALIFYESGSNSPLWITDGTIAGTLEISGDFDSTGMITPVGTIGDEIYFWYNDGFGYTDLRACNVVTQVVRVLRRVRSIGGTFQSLPNVGAVGLADEIIAPLFGNGKVQLWRTDGTIEGTLELKITDDFQIAGTPELVRLDALVASEESVFFTGVLQDHEGRYGILGSVAPKALEYSLASFPDPSATSHGLAILEDGRAVYVLDGSLWASDGTETGTTEIVGDDTLSSVLGVVSDTILLSDKGGQLLAVDLDGALAWQLDIQISSNALIWRVGEKLYFTVHGGERSSAWISDGTLQGTHAMLDTFPATHRGNIVTSAWLQGEFLYYNSQPTVIYPDSGVIGGFRETDGTSRGTRILSAQPADYTLQRIPDERDRPRSHRLYGVDDDGTTNFYKLFVSSRKLQNVLWAEFPAYLESGRDYRNYLWGEDALCVYRYRTANSIGGTSGAIASPFEAFYCVAGSGSPIYDAPFNEKSGAAIAGTRFVYKAEVDGRSYLRSFDAATGETIELRELVDRGVRLISAGTKVYFSDSVTTNSASPNKIWMTDGRPEGTLPLQTGENYDIRQAVYWQGLTLLRIIDDGTGEISYLQTDGTPQRTHFLEGIDFTGATEVVIDRNEAGLLLQVSFPNKTELWLADGSSAIPWKLFESPFKFYDEFTNSFAYKGRIYFRRRTLEAGVEPWMVELRTRSVSPLDDVVSGPASGIDVILGAVNDRLIVRSGRDPEVGFEPYAIPLPTAADSEADKSLLAELAQRLAANTAMIDTDADGKLSLSEMRPHVSMLERSFLLSMDVDGDYLLSKSELKRTSNPKQIACGFSEAADGPLWGDLLFVLALFVILPAYRYRFMSMPRH